MEAVGQGTVHLSPWGPYCDRRGNQSFFPNICTKVARFKPNRDGWDWIGWF